MTREQLLALLKATTSAPSKELPGGGHLIGHVPSVAPLFYLHEVFAPLAETECELLARDIGLPTPAAYVAFLRATNGLKIFGTSICLFGKRVGSSSQPFDFVVANTFERPVALGVAEVVVGVFSFDGSPLTMSPGSAEVRWRELATMNVLRTWSSVAELISSEVHRLQSLFAPTYEGLRIGRRVCSLPRSDRAATQA